MNPEADMIAQQELDSGERLLWAGSGSPGRLATKGIPAALIGVPFTAFAVFWMWMAAGARVPDIRGGRAQDYFWLWGVPFVIVGLGMLLTPVRMYVRALNTVYAVTDRRALIITTGRSRTVKSYGPAEAARVDRREHGDGTGDLTFASEESEQQRRRSNLPLQLNMPNGFFGIRDARTVEQLLLNLARKEGQSKF